MSQWAIDDGIGRRFSLSGAPGQVGTTIRYRGNLWVFTKLDYVNRVAYLRLATADERREA